MKVFSLLAADWVIFSRWFRKQSLAKLIIASFFGFIFIALAGFIYAYSRTFFTSLLLYDRYGQFLADYVLQAGVLVLLWFGWVTAFLASLALVLGRSANLEYLATLPVSGRELALWSQIKIILTNFLLVSAVLAPAILGYQSVTHQLQLFWLFLALILLTLLTLGLGMITAYLWLAVFRRQNIFGFVIAVAVIVVSGLGLVRLIFPPALLELYYLPTEDFFTVVNSLPLLHSGLYSTWITQLALGQSQSLVSLVTLTVVTYLFGFIIHSGYLIRSWRHSWSRLIASRTVTLQIVWQVFPAPLVMKDILTIIRIRKELVYAVLQLSLAAVMFGLIQRATLFRPLSRLESEQIISLTYVWLMFFAVSYLLRFVFPLAAREGKSLWLVLPLLSRGQLLVSKLISAIVISLPLLLLNIGLWLASPFANHGLLVGFTEASLLVMILFLTLAGFLKPEFTQALEAEKASTSLLGLAALAASIVWTGLTARSLSLWLNSQPLTAANSLIGAIFVLVILARLSWRSNFRQ